MTRFMWAVYRRARDWGSDAMFFIGDLISSGTIWKLLINLFVIILSIMSIAYNLFGWRPSGSEENTKESIEVIDVRNHVGGDGYLDFSLSARGE